MFSSNFYWLTIDFQSKTYFRKVLKFLSKNGVKLLHVRRHLQAGQQWELDRDLQRVGCRAVTTSPPGFLIVILHNRPIMI